MENKILTDLRRALVSQEKDYNPALLLDALRRVSYLLRTEGLPEAADEKELHAVHSLKDAAAGILNHIYSNPLGEPGILRSGFHCFDETFRGFHKGEVAILGARPGTGKSFLLTHLALKMAQCKKTICYFSLEGSAEMIAQRAVAILSQVPCSEVRSGNLSPAELDRIEKAVQEISDQHFLFYARPVFDAAHLHEKVKQLVEKHNIEAVFIDYLQLLVAPQRHRTRESELAAISASLKRLAREFNVAVIVASQLSRAVEQRGGSRRPQLSDLRDSGAIEQDADKVIFLYRPELAGIQMDDDGKSTEGKCEIIMAKNRSGVIGQCHLLFYADGTGYSDLSTVLPETGISDERLEDLL